MSDTPADVLLADVERVGRIPVVPTILEVVCRTTGMGFAAVARVTEDRWMACSVLDQIGFGLKSGGELPVETTICHEIRQSCEPVVIDHVAQDDVWCSHATPAKYGFQSYISMPIILPDGEFFGTLCAIDPHPARLRSPEVIETFRLFAELISRHLEAQRKLTSTESALSLARKVMDSHPDCVGLLDLEGRWISTNRNVCRLLGVEGPATLVATSWLALWDGPERTKAATAFQLVLQGTEHCFDLSSKTIDGEPKYWEVVLTPILDSAHTPSHVLCIFRDLTARRVEEVKLRETAKLESLGLLAGGIAHDFNNLLTGILGNASLLETAESEEDATLAHEIVKAAQRAADLTRQMLAYAGNGRFVLEPVNLSAAIREVLPLIKPMFDKKVKLVLTFQPDLPLITADPGQIRQLVMNLVINGLDAMEGRAGELSLITSTIEVDQAFSAQTFRPGESSLSVGSYVCLDVRDTGSGITEEILPRIFDPFFTTKFAGRGLGLAAVSGILRSHGGGISVTTQPGKGSSIQAFFPVAKDVPRRSPDHGRSDRKARGTIFLIDDEETVRRIGKLTLERFGYHVLLAENGSDAVSLFTAHRPQIRLIILDLTMPVMNGEETLAALRKIDPHVPVLLSSGYAQSDLVERFDRQKVTGFIQKPYTAQRLNDAVEKALLTD